MKTTAASLNRFARILFQEKKNTEVQPTRGKPQPCLPAKFEAQTGNSRACGYYSTAKTAISVRTFMSSQAVPMLAFVPSGRDNTRPVHLT